MSPEGLARAGDEVPVLQARGLTKIYRMGEVSVHALRGLDIALFAGELVVLLGASGSGKSTLLNIIGGLDTPTAGEFFYRGEDLSHAESWELTRYPAEHRLARLRPVTIGQRNGSSVRIIEGLEAASRVVVHPSDRVRDGVELALR